MEIDKATLRAALLAGRRRRSDADRVAAQEAVGGHLLDAVQGCGTIALFLPLPSEPLGRSTVDALAGAHRILLPVARADQPLDWAEAGGGVRRGSWGIDEPAGPPLGPDALRSADLVLVPALAVDLAGRRLGRGGGHYDRTLARLAERPGGPLLLAVVFDDELLPEVPVEAVDRPVDAVLTPSGGLTNLHLRDPGAPR